MNWSDLLLIDVPIMQLFNIRFAHPYLDQFFLYLTQLHKLPWFLYIALPVLLLFMIYDYRLHIFKILFVVGVGVAITDLVSYRLVKNYFPRERPFQNEATRGWVRKVGEAHGSSFPSNHAANCFAGASLLAWYMRRRRDLLYSFAGLVAISRVYLGVHFPTDVIGGAIVGILVALLVKIVLLHHIDWFWIYKPVSNEEDIVSDWRSRSRRMSEG